jgi:spermidine/putrescine transport system ATP-binding protein
MTTLASIANISMRYGRMTALDDVSLDIAKSSYTILLGPSGSGKTTLLSILGGFLQPTSGRVLINGADCTTMPPALRPTATVFQDYALFPHMTVGNNVGFGLRMRGLAKSERDERAAVMLKTVGLPDAFHKKPHQLSGGQRQRVALARALVVEPQLLLLDEPLGALDMKLRRQMQDELKALQQRVGTAFVHVTHDQEEAMALADQVVVMDKGRIEDMGTPEKVYANPSTAFSAGFMGENTLVPAASPVARRIGVQSGLAALRPEHIMLTNKNGNLGNATIDTITYQGSFKRITATSAEDKDLTFTIRAAAELDVRAQQAVSLHIDAVHIARIATT